MKTNGLIDAATSPNPNAFVARLAAQAGRIAKARAEMALRERGRDPRAWRQAGLLWPLFGKER
ncbi:hypothetical protein [Tsuneonella mangrovi]|uniref:hypothetical protein n=1 Tax=Tsuneonella mangrovi TaxID=1982042 RepID=UPI000BA29884|nr:hypothetical protein [Tsuneonella mangrovi]